MNRDCKPTIPLLDDAVDVLSKDKFKAWCCSVVSHDTSTTPSSASYPRPHSIARPLCL